MIVRVYRARVRPGTEAQYVALIHEHVIPAAHEVDGLAAYHVGRRMEGRSPEFVIVTVWRSLAALQSVAGADWLRPIFFHLEESLLESWTVEHFEAIASESLAEG